MSANILTIVNKYNTEAKCMALLEQIRWGKVVTCVFCGSKKTKLLKGKSRRHSCQNCNHTFSVKMNTIFEGTPMPLTKWFLVIASMLNSKSGISAKELQRNYGLTYKTAYYAAMRIRIGMLMPSTKLHGILEMDEAYFGGKARKANTKEAEPTLSTVVVKRGRGTKKISVAGIVARQGEIKTKVVEKLTKRNLLAFLKRSVKKDDSILITDGFRSYKKLDEYIEHLTINHSKQFSKGTTHINTIEGFWSYVKGGIRGNFKSVSPKYLPLYLVQYEWQYNHRHNKGDLFTTYLKNALKHEKELEYWKAKDKQEVKEIAYEN